MGVKNNSEEQGLPPGNSNKESDCSIEGTSCYAGEPIESIRLGSNLRQNPSPGDRGSGSHQNVGTWKASRHCQGELAEPKTQSQ